MRFVVLILCLGACTTEVAGSGHEGDADDPGDSADNQPPLAGAASFTMLRNQMLTGQLTGTDADGDTLIFALATSPESGTAVASIDGSFTYTPSFDFLGTDHFDFRVSDGNATSEPATVTITVDLEPGAPTASAQLVSLDEDSTAPITLTGTDPDGDALSAAVVLQPQHGELSGAAPSLTYTPDHDYYGADSFTFTVSDGTHTSTAATVGITVLPIQDAPSAVAQSPTTPEDVPLLVVLNGVDPDPESLLFDIDPEPVHGTLGLVTIESSRTATVLYTPDADYHGADSFGFAVDDGLAIDEATVDLTITPVPDVPVANAASFELTEDQGAEPLTLTGQDADGDALSFEILTQPSHGTLGAPVPAGPGAIAVDYTPDGDFFGTDSFTFRVSADGDDSAPATVTLDVAGVGDPVVANPDGTPVTVANTLLEALPGHPLTAFAGLVDNDGDPDGDATVLLPASTLHGGTLTIVDASVGSFTYLPPAGYTGPDSFTYTLTDGDNFATASVDLEVVGPVIWYVDNGSSASSHTGRSTEPFTTLASAAGVALAGQIFFVDTGSATYGGGLLMLPNQKLIGRGTGLAAAPNVDLQPGVRPAITAAGTIINVNNGTTVSGVNLTGGTHGLRAASVTGLTVSGVGIVNTSSMAVWLESASGALAFSDFGVSLVSGDIVLIQGAASNPSLTFDNVQLATGGGHGVSAYDLASFAIDGDLPLDDRPSTLSVAGGDALHLVRVAGADVSFAQLSGVDSPGSGIYFESVEGLARFPDATLSDAGLGGVELAGGALDFQYTGDITGAGERIIEINNVDGSMSFTGGVLSSLDGFVVVQDVSGPVVIEQIQMGSAVDRVQSGVHLLNDADVSIGSLEVYSDDGGLYADGVDHLVIDSGFLDSTGESAFAAYNSGLEVTLERLVYDGILTGLRMADCTGDLAVTGDALDSAGSGGALTGLSPAQVNVLNFDNLTLRHMTLSGLALQGLTLDGVDSATLEYVNVVDAPREALAITDGDDVALRDCDLASLGQISSSTVQYIGTVSSFVVERTQLDNAPGAPGLRIDLYGGTATLLLDELESDGDILVYPLSGAVVSLVVENSTLSNSSLHLSPGVGTGPSTLSAEVTRTSFLGGVGPSAISGLVDAGCTLELDVHDNGLGSPGGFVNLGRHAMQVFVEGGTLLASIDHNQFDGDGAFDDGVELWVNGSGPAPSRILMSHNVVTDFTGHTVVVYGVTAGTTHLTFDSNTVGTLASNPSISGLAIGTWGGNPSVIASLSGNVIHSGGAAVTVASNDSGSIDFTAAGNTLVGAGLSVYTDVGGRACADLNSQDSVPNSSDGNPGYSFYRTAGSTSELGGYGGAGTDDAAIAAYVQSRNTGTVSVISGGAPGITGVVACATPLLP